MSFVEKNKAWLLPLLGLAAAGVVYMNLRTFQGSAAPAVAEGQPPAETPENPEPAPPPEALPSAEEGGDGDLWGDLRGLAEVPSALKDEGALRARARTGITDLMKPLDPPSVLRPAVVREPKAPPPPGAAPEAAPGEPPPLDFLVQGGQGGRAWFEGAPFRSGQALPGTGLVVGPISGSKVTLKGPSGPRVLSTNPLHAPAPEAP